MLFPFALEALSLNHWTSMEVPAPGFLMIKIHFLPHERIRNRKEGEKPCLLRAVTPSSLGGSYQLPFRAPAGPPAQGGREARPALRPGGSLSHALCSPRLHRHKPIHGAQASGHLCSQDTWWFPDPVLAPSNIFSQDGAERAKKFPLFLFSLHKAAT